MSKTLQQELTDYRKSLASYRAIYQEDGTITADEQNHLDSLERKVEQLLDAIGQQDAQNGNGQAASPGGTDVKAASSGGSKRASDGGPDAKADSPTGASGKTASKTPAAGDEALTPEFFALDEVEAARASFLTQQLEASAFCGAASDVLQVADKKFSELFRVYAKAYKDYEAAIKAGGAEADNQEMWKNIVIGAAASVAVAAVASVALPAAAAAAITEAPGTWLAFNSASAAGGSVAGTAAGSATAFDKEGLDPSRNASPEVQQLRVWKQFADLGKSAAAISKLGFNTVLGVDVANYAIAEIRRHVEGGKPDMSVDDTLDMVESILKFHRGRSALSLSDKTKKLRTAKAAVDGLEIKSAQAMEQDIWILWMSGLKSDSGVLDYDAIEDRLHKIGVLGPSSRLGIDFGMYTSDDDEAKAIKAAKTAAKDIKKEYDKLGVK